MANILLQILTVAYAAVGIIVTIGYIPTIRDLWQYKKMSSNISSYVIWTICSTITVLYSIFILPDLLFQIVSGLIFASNALILILSILLVYHKY